MNSPKIIKKRNSGCERCGSKDDLTVDHIIPLSILKSLHLPIKSEQRNLQVLCGKCNKMKKNFLDTKHPKTLPLLEHYVNEYKHRFGWKKERSKYVFKNLAVISHSETTYFEAVDPEEYRIDKLKNVYRRQKLPRVVGIKEL